METKKRLIKGSEEAKQWMANLRALKKISLKKIIK